MMVIDDLKAEFDINLCDPDRIPLGIVVTYVILLLIHCLFLAQRQSTNPCSKICVKHNGSYHRIFQDSQAPGVSFPGQLAWFNPAAPYCTMCMHSWVLWWTLCHQPGVWLLESARSFSHEANLSLYESTSQICAIIFIFDRCHHS